MHHTRRALPYWRSMRARKSFSVVESARVARQHLVGERKTLRGHHQRNDHLHAVRAMIARVTVAALVLLVGRRIGLEIRAREVIQQHIEARVEQIPPATHQMIEQRLLVLEQPVVTGVERVNVGQRGIRAQQIAQRAALKPVPMQTPLAARRRAADTPPAPTAPDRSACLCAMGASRSPQNSSSPSCCHSFNASQQAPHCRGRSSRNCASFRRTIDVVRDHPFATILGK